MGPPLFSPVEDRGPVDFPMSVYNNIKRQLLERLIILLLPVSAKTLKAVQAQGPAKIYINCRSCKSMACLNSSNQCNSDKLLPVQQDLQMLHLPVHPLYCQPGPKDLQISWRLFILQSLCCKQMSIQAGTSAILDARHSFAPITAWTTLKLLRNKLNFFLKLWRWWMASSQSVP